MAASSRETRLNQAAGGDAPAPPPSIDEAGVTEAPLPSSYLPPFPLSHHLTMTLAYTAVPPYPNLFRHIPLRTTCMLVPPYLCGRPGHGEDDVQRYVELLRTVRVTVGGRVGHDRVSDEGLTGITGIRQYAGAPGAVQDLLDLSGKGSGFSCVGLGLRISRPDSLHAY